MADTKISDLTAATAAAAANEFVINEAGVSKKLTGTLLQEFAGRKLISGNSGAANALAAPSETWQVLTSDAASNSTTTFATVMTTSALPVGTYQFRYMVRYQTSVTTTGVKFSVDYSGTTTHVLARHLFAVEASTASSLVADSGFVGTAAGLLTAIEFRSDAGVAGPTASADTANANMLWTVEGLLVVSTSANLTLMHASETAAATTVMSGTNLILKRFV